MYTYIYRSTILCNIYIYVFVYVYMNICLCARVYILFVHAILIFRDNPQLFNSFNYRDRICGVLQD